MLFRKKAQVPEAKKFVESIEPYTCTTCGCLVARRRAHKVLVTSGFGRVHFYYCGRCAPPYNQKFSYNTEVHFYLDQPAKEIEVDEKGKPIKKKK